MLSCITLPMLFCRYEGFSQYVCKEGIGARERSQMTACIQAGVLHLSSGFPAGASQPSVSHLAQ